MALIDQNVVRLATRKAARHLVLRYRFFTRHCVGNVHTDDGEGGEVTLKNRGWAPPRIGDQSAGMLIGWLQGGSTTWRRVLATRVGRTVSVLDVVSPRPARPGPTSSPSARWRSSASDLPPGRCRGPDAAGHGSEVAPHLLGRHRVAGGLVEPDRCRVVAEDVERHRGGAQPARGVVQGLQQRTAQAPAAVVLVEPDVEDPGRDA